jgi:hypothetical protein
MRTRGIAADNIGARLRRALRPMTNLLNPSPRAPRSRRRLLTVLAVVAGACALAGLAASPASATPPVGTLYCMDGSQTFATWDATSASVSDLLVKSFGGVLTLGEVDPANVGRDAVRQYYDALETSDAIGSPGIDTTIPNYVVHFIKAGACPYVPAENHVFLCYSKYEVDPGVWPAREAQKLLTEGYWQPSAMSGTTPGGTNVGEFHLVCNPPASVASNDSYVGGDGSVTGSAAAGLPGYYPYFG